MSVSISDLHKERMEAINDFRFISSVELGVSILQIGKPISSTAVTALKGSKTPKK